MSGGGVSVKKSEYLKKAIDLFSKYDTFMLVGCDNVGSKHMQAIRRSLYPSKSILLMGKNTLMRKAIQEVMQDKPALADVIPLVVGNVGFVFTESDDIATLRTEIESNKVGAPAKAGAIAPCDVHIPKGNTGLEPTQTSFLQALNIATKIARGQIEILNPVHLVVAGERVGSSEAVLLQKMKIMPFTYGLVVSYCFDKGSLYPATILDISDDDLIAAFLKGVSNIAAIGLSTGIPNTASVPHSLRNGFKNIFAISLMTDVPVTYEIIKSTKDLMNDPEAMAAAAAAAAAASAGAASGGAAAAAEAEPEPEEEEEEEEMFSLFE